MFYGALATVTSFFALLILAAAVRMLLRGTWFWAWLKGTAAVLCVALAASLGLIAYDMYSYQQLSLDKPVATVSFERVEKQAFIATVALTDSGETREFYLRGDQWQMDARILRWKSIIRSMGGKPGYRLDRISGRYLTLEDERTQERTVYSLHEQDYGLDFWAWAYKKEGQAPLLDAAYGSATYVPMVDGALFEVALSQSGLVAKPLNAAAQKAVQVWLN